ncbi:hypothetical protein ACP4OV_030467 [Aristida adscensionis]
MQDSKGFDPELVVFDVQPLRAVPMKGRGEAPTMLREKKAATPKEKHEAPIPQWMKNFKSYKEGDWTVYYTLRSDGQRDWIYCHREYRRKFRSRCEVELLLKSNGPTDLFKGLKLQRKAARWFRRSSSCVKELPEMEGLPTVPQDQMF